MRSYTGGPCHYDETNVAGKITSLQKHHVTVFLPEIQRTVKLTIGEIINSGYSVHEGAAIRLMRSQITSGACTPESYRVIPFKYHP